MFKKGKKKRNRAMLSAYSIIMILIIALGIASHLLPKPQYTAVVLEEESAVVEESTTEAEVAATDVAVSTVEAEAATTTTAPVESQSADAVNQEATTATEVKPVVEEVETEEVAEPKIYNTLEECEAENEACDIVNGSGVVGAELYQILIAPILGFEDAVDVAAFLLVLGGFLAVLAKTKALEDGIKVLVHKMHGKELWLIPILMFIFSICGTTYGMLEETVGFYALLAATMYAAGMDPLVGAATVLLGAGAGVLGSTINPFATGVALSAMKDAGVEYDQGKVLLIGTVLWLVTYAIATTFVVLYARKVKRDKGSTFLSLREQANAEKKYGKYVKDANEETHLTGKQKITLVLLALAFLVMIVGFIPWADFEITFFDGWTGWLTGAVLGGWWFYEAALWFLIIAIIMCIVNGYGEKGFVDTFIDGADDMVGVIFVVAVARGASVLMGVTHLDNYIIYNASNFLATLPELAFVPLNFILHVFLSFLVPSSSGLAALSTPIIAPLAGNLGYSTEVAAMTIVSANGLVNLITPTCGAIMGGLALAKIDYPTWFKWGIRVVGVLCVSSIAILCLFSLA